MSFAYYPQYDRQAKALNKFLEMYLGCFDFPNHLSLQLKLFHLTAALYMLEHNFNLQSFCICIIFIVVAVVDAAAVCVK
jgi:hypothetical protein